MALYRLERDLGDLLGRFPEEALGGGMKRSLVFLDLDLGDTVHQDGNALRRVASGVVTSRVITSSERLFQVWNSGITMSAPPVMNFTRPRPETTMTSFGPAFFEKGEVGEDVPHDRDGSDRESGQHDYVSENQLHCRRPSFLLLARDQLDSTRSVEPTIFRTFT